MLPLLIACTPATPTIGESVEGDVATPDVELSESFLEFRGIGIGEEAGATVTVTNAGDADLTLGAPVTSDATGVFTVTGLGADTLAAGESTTFDVRFAPTAEVTVVSTIVMTTNDPDEPTVDIQLLGDWTAPALAIEPTSYDFGRLSRACAAEQAFTFANEGTSPLTVSAVEATGGDDAFGVVLDEQTWGPLPWTLAPGEARGVTATFTPPWLGEFAGSLVVTSDDPANPSAAVSLDGEGIAEEDHAEVFYVSGGVVDIVMSVYAGDSMDDEEDDVVDAAATFIDALDDEVIDWRLAIVQDDEGCVTGSDVWIDRSMSSSTQLSVVERMLSDENPAIHGFQVLEYALDSAAIGTDGCNEGLLRGEARLALVGITDQGGMPTAGWSHYVDLFRDMKPTDDDVTMHGIAPNRAEGCGTSSASSGWHEAAQETGGQDLLVCDDMADNFEAIAGALAQVSATFGLGATPETSTIEVTVSGEPFEAWTYDAGANAITLETDGLRVGSVVNVAYEEAPDCPE